MTSKKRLVAVALAGLMLLSSVSAASAVSSTTANTAANDSLVVAVENAGNDGATVSVSHNDTAVANASVTVETQNTSYTGVGEYTTDADGEVSPPEPEENVTVEVTAAKGNMTGSTTATIHAVGGEGEEKTFGDLVSSFVHEMLNAGDDGGPIGQAVSEFVTENNPGNADEKRPDHAGKPDDAGKNGKDKGKPDDAGKNGKDKGKPDDAGSANKTDDDGGSQGPPENAGNDKGDDSDSDSDSDSDKGNGNGKGKGKGK
ncbi:hypothetical protein [Halorussus ruber]|uniref:hypothetical protein n=1 Tax=Halorussus ruber TaxID=1126238 RepID=UPI001092E325|nr:hypothetical protein [Halorussus ruber]